MRSCSSLPGVCKGGGNSDAPMGRKDHGCGEEAAICKPKREVSRENKAADTLILDLQLPDLSKNKLLLLKPHKPVIVCFGGLSRLMHRLHSPTPHL